MKKILLSVLIALVMVIIAASTCFCLYKVSSPSKTNVKMGVDLATNGNFENGIDGWNLNPISGNIIVGQGYKYKDEKGRVVSSWIWTNRGFRSVNTEWTEVQIWSGRESDNALIADGSFFFVLSQRIPAQGYLEVDESIQANLSFWMKCNNFTGIKAIRTETFHTNGDSAIAASHQPLSDYTSDWHAERSGTRLDPETSYVIYTIAIAGEGTVAIDDFSFIPATTIKD